MPVIKKFREFTLALKNSWYGEVLQESMMNIKIYDEINFMESYSLESLSINDQNI